MRRRTSDPDLAKRAKSLVRQWRVATGLESTNPSTPAAVVAKPEHLSRDISGTNGTSRVSKTAVDSIPLASLTKNGTEKRMPLPLNAREHREPPHIDATSFLNAANKRKRKAEEEYSYESDTRLCQPLEKRSLLINGKCDITPVTSPSSSGGSATISPPTPPPLRPSSSSISPKVAPPLSTANAPPPAKKRKTQQRTSQADLLRAKFASHAKLKGVKTTSELVESIVPDYVHSRSAPCTPTLQNNVNSRPAANLRTVRATATDGKQILMDQYLQQQAASKAKERRPPSPAFLPIPGLPRSPVRPVSPPPTPPSPLELDTTKTPTVKGSKMPVDVPRKAAEPEPPPAKRKEEMEVSTMTSEELRPDGETTTRIRIKIGRRKTVTPPPTEKEALPVTVPEPLPPPKKIYANVEEEVQDILSRLPPLVPPDGEEPLDSDVEEDEPDNQSNVSVRSLHEDSLPGVNGQYDHLKRFRRWHESYSQVSHDDEVLPMLPYTVIR